MADKYGVILQLYSRARAPNRDYYGLTISNSDVTLNIWNITHGPHVFPKKQKCPLEDVQIARSFLSEIQRLFGQHVANYCLALGRGDAQLECLPTKVFLKILRNLASNDILKLGQSSKIFFELCNRNDVWGIIFTKRNKGQPTREEVKAAEQKGWKNIIRNKVAWSNRVNHKQKTGKGKEVSKNTKTAEALQSKKPEVKKEVTKVVPQKTETFESIKSAKVEIPIPTNTGNLQTPIRSTKVQLLRTINTVTKHDVVISTNILNDVSKLDSNALKTRSLTALPRKGILKKSTSSIPNANTSLTRSVPLEGIPEKPVLTTIDCQPMTKDELKSMSGPSLERATRINSLLNGLHLPKEIATSRAQAAKDRRLERLLTGIDEKTATNPFKLVPKVLETSALSSTVTTKPPFKNPESRLTKTPLKPQPQHEPKIGDFLASLTADEKFSTSGKMTTKFENYLTTLKAGQKPKADIIPKISELTRSINELRSSFYNGDKLKMKIGPNLNNTKVTNQNGRSQQLNNKLNNIAPKSTSATSLVMKRNAFKPQSKSAVSALKPNSVKVKNTNCSPTPVVKPTNASNMAAKSGTNINVRKI